MTDKEMRQFQLHYNCMFVNNLGKITSKLKHITNFKPKENDTKIRIRE